MLQLVSRKRLVLMRDDTNILYTRGKYYISDDLGKKGRCLGAIPFHGIHTIGAQFPLIARIFRIEPRCAEWINKYCFIVAQRGAVWHVNTQTGLIHREHCFETGMTAPLKFCTLKNMKNISDGILYGTYRSKPNADVSIWHRNAKGEWRIVFTFPIGRVLHIHKLIPDYKKGRILALTGDSDSESGIWEFQGSFEKPKLLLGGSQQYRACAAFPEDGHILYATDTPLEKNYLYDYDENSGQVKPLLQLPGPVIHSGSFFNNGEQVYCFSTSVEPDSRLHGISYFLTRKLGAGVLTRQSHVFIGNRKRGFREVCLFQKDIWPMALFEFGNVAFPDGESEHLYACPRSVKYYSGKTVEVIP